MIDYIKMILLSIFTGLTAPMPVSSSAHFNFFANVLQLSQNENILSFYYNVFMLCFSFVLFFSLRKIYFGCLKANFVSKKNCEKYNKTAFYRKINKNLLLSLIPAAVLFIPIAENKLLVDYFKGFLNKNGLILAGIASIMSALVLVISLWYTRRKETPSKKSATGRVALRMAFYQLPCYIIPGFSHIASGATNLLICDINSKTLVRELYLYFAPSLCLISAVNIIRLCFAGIIIDPIILLVGCIIFILASRLMVYLASKINLRRLFSFFAIYSVIFGVFIAVASFYI